MDPVLDTKPKVKRRGDPIPSITAMERLLGRELDSDPMLALDLMDDGKKSNMDLLLEIGACAGRTFVDATYPDPKFDLPEWSAGG